MTIEHARVPYLADYCEETFQSRSGKLRMRIQVRSQIFRSGPAFGHACSNSSIHKRNSTAIKLYDSIHNGKSLIKLQSGVQGSSSQTGCVATVGMFQLLLGSSELIEREFASGTSSIQGCCSTREVLKREERFTLADHQCLLSSIKRCSTSWRKKGQKDES